MRPRGESISSPQLWYVGHAGRQNPQCTHSSISLRSGMLQAPYEAAWIEAMLRIEVVLEAPHEREARRRRSPWIDSESGRRGLNDQRTSEPRQLRARVGDE